MIYINDSSLELFGVPMAIYNLMFICIVISAIIFSYFFAKWENLNTTHIFRMTALIFFLAFLGFMNKEMIPKSINWALLASMVIFVLVMYYIIAKIMKVDEGTIMCLGSFCLMFAGIFTKLGCFFAGCCYGWKYDGFGAVIYGNKTENPHKGVPLFPIQLCISMAILLLLIISVLVYRKTKISRFHFAIATTSMTCALLYLNNVLSIAPYNNILIGKINVFLTIFIIFLAISIGGIVKLFIINRKEI